MNHNPAIQNVPTVAWSGTAAFPMDITRFAHFGWSFEVTAPLGADTIFRVQAAPPSAADPCVPGAFVDVPEVVICQAPAVPGALAELTLPAATAVGSILAGTIPCRPNSFVRLQPVSGGTANVRAIGVRQGPLV